MDYILKEKDAYLFEFLKHLKGDFPPVWSPFVLYGKDNSRHGIGCPNEVFMRDNAYKQKMSEIIKQTYDNGRKPSSLGIPCSEKSKQASAAANSKSYRITHKDGSVEIITNLNQWCRDNNHRDPAVHRAIKEQKPYKGMIVERL